MDRYFVAEYDRRDAINRVSTKQLTINMLYKFFTNTFPVTDNLYFFFLIYLFLFQVIYYFCHDFPLQRDSTF